MTTVLSELKLRSMTFDFSRTYIMGIINVTPDSFSDGGQFLSPDQALKQIERQIQEGADLIDIGAESTRPGAQKVTLEEEIQRLEPILRVYKRHFDTPLSLDTSKSETASMGLAYGVDIINDISALRADPEMAAVANKHRCPVILMHMQGEPATMQSRPQYTHVVTEVVDFLAERLEFARRAGLTDIILDPGIGFGKSPDHNLQLIKHVDALKRLDCPVLMGVSRKSFIGAITGAEVQNRLPGSLAAAVFAAMSYSHFIRVHDVAAHKQALQIADALRNSV